jgi:hypothetical protein
MPKGRPAFVSGQIHWLRRKFAGSFLRRGGSKINRPPGRATFPFVLRSFSRHTTTMMCLAGLLHPERVNVRSDKYAKIESAQMCIHPEL